MPKRASPNPAAVAAVTQRHRETVVREAMFSPLATDGSTITRSSFRRRYKRHEAAGIIHGDLMNGLLGYASLSKLRHEDRIRSCEPRPALRFPILVAGAAIRGDHHLVRV